MQYNLHYGPIPELLLYNIPVNCLTGTSLLNSANPYKSESFIFSVSISKFPSAKQKYLVKKAINICNYEKNCNQNTAGRCIILFFAFCCFRKAVWNPRGRMIIKIGMTAVRTILILAEIQSSSTPFATVWHKRFLNWIHF